MAYVKTEDNLGRQVKPLVGNESEDGTGTWHALVCDSSGYLKTKLQFVTDDVLFKLGTDSDIVLLNRSTILATNTSLENVLIGTPVTPALAANSLIISNVTENGDVLIAANDGGTSYAGIFLDGSEGETHIRAKGAIRLMASSDVDDYLSITTVSNVVTLTATGSSFNFVGAAEFDAITLGGTLTATGQIISALAGFTLGAGGYFTSIADNSYIQIYGGGGTAGCGAYVTLTGKSFGAPGQFDVYTPNAAGNADINRLSITSGATAVLTLSAVTVTGLNITSGQVLKVAGVQVVGARVIDERCDDVVDSTYGAEEAGVLDALRDAMITHGLIAAA